MMKKIALAGAAALTLSACTQHEQRVAGSSLVGAGAGAIIGAAATGNARGAAVGAAIGGATGAVIGHVTDQPNNCYYRDQYGQTYVAPCP
jgi:hypothetical protein